MSTWMVAGPFDLSDGAITAGNDIVTATGNIYVTAGNGSIVTINSVFIPADDK